MPDLSEATTNTEPIRAADGLDWPLRLAAVWQQVLNSPVRSTQGNTLFKKDLARLQTDEVLSGRWAGEVAHPPDLGVLALLWAAAGGLLAEASGELTATPFGETWEKGLPAVLSELLAALVRVEAWDPVAGYVLNESGLSPTPTAGFIALLLLAKADPSAWVSPAALAGWLWTHHPTWAGVIPQADASNQGTAWVVNWLLGVAQPLQLVEAAGEWIRLTAFGRYLFNAASAPPPAPVFPQTLLVQPNAEILAYRQGLTPALIATLSRLRGGRGLARLAHWNSPPSRHIAGSNRA